MKRKEKSTEIMLTNNYVSKSVIQHFFGTTPTIAQSIFDKCKKMELSKVSIDPRPHRVMTRTVFKEMGIDYSFTLKQYKQSQERRPNERNI